ncbi:FISUMP domain-containing protein [Bacteroidota bacterium]
MKKLFIIILSLMFLTFSCRIQDTGTFKDTRDSSIYKVVQIGEQKWMSENLAFLPSVSDSMEGSVTEPYYYVYGYGGTNVNEAKATKNYTSYGALYNWEAAKIACPKGWHLPSDEEWKTLELEIGMTKSEVDGGIRMLNNIEIHSSRRGNNEGGKLKSTGTTYWLNPNYGATNESGFSALPAGRRSIHLLQDVVTIGPSHDFYGLGMYSYFWSATESERNWIWLRILVFKNQLVNRIDLHKAYGFSVRCIKDE